MGLKAVRNISDAPYNNAYVYALRPQAEVLVDDHWASYLVSTGRFEVLPTERTQELAELGFTQEWDVFYQETEQVVVVDERITELKSTVNDELITEPEPEPPIMDEVVTAEIVVEEVTTEEAVEEATEEVVEDTTVDEVVEEEVAEETEEVTEAPKRRGRRPKSESQPETE